MNLLYVASHFPSENKGATIYTDLAEALSEAGHGVTVAVSEQAKNMRHNRIAQERGFEVLRVVTGNLYDVSLIEKGITTLKMPFLMRKGIKQYLGKRKYDLILFESPPVTYATMADWAKRQFNCPAYLMLKDIFPQNAIDLGIMNRNGPLYRYFRAKETKLYKTADYIGCMSEVNRRYLIEHNPWLDASKIEVFPNTKKLTEDINPEGLPMRHRYGIPDESCVFLCGGNMGKPQYIELLCEAIKRCKDEPRINFLFVGRGTDRYKLEQTINTNRINNALLVEDLPRHEYEQITKECDIGLVTLDPRFTIPNCPSRILSYMEYSKPVLAATDMVCDYKQLIDEAGCGEWVWSGDIESFVSKAIEMSKSGRLNEMGRNGRRYIETHFDVSRSVQILEERFA